ncbi:cysteine desulfurase-like protein [Ornithinimicrobium cavernae]|uniref:cysteine desulfurase-like protein n=1 Tax=Ornithinimicrobium cavernae TaxID=2666047 RepID=UPI000D69CDF4|nr:cysteine desulfurase-like protein [Ornithinimicrobium cavernae]
MTYDVAAVRAQFPALAEGAAHFDGPGGTQTPEPVARAVADTLLAAVANRGTVTAAERRAEEIVGAARRAMGDLLAVEPRGVVFGRSATELTFHVSRTLAAGWEPGDEVVVSRLDHDCNVRPWLYAAEQAGATVRWVDFDPATGELTTKHLSAALSGRTVLVALTAASNLIGTRPDLPAIAELVHGVGAQLWVDGVHATAHALPDLEASGADFWVCSPYKFLGPHCGVLAARPETLEPLRPAKLLPSTDAVPERFELGTLPYELLAGTTAAVDFLADLVPGQTGTRRERLATSYAALEGHEEHLLSRLEPALRELPGVRLHSNAARRTPTLLLTIEGVDPQTVRQHLADRGVNAPAGHFYAWETSHHLGLGADGGVRVGLAPYTDEADVDRLLEGLRTLPCG